MENNIHSVVMKAVSIFRKLQIILMIRSLSSRTGWIFTTWYWDEKYSSCDNLSDEYYKALKDSNDIKKENEEMEKENIWYKTWNAHNAVGAWQSEWAD